MSLPNIEEYAFAERRMPYSTEEMEISKADMKKLKSLRSAPVTPFSDTFEKENGPTKLIIDTDVGTDLDDSLAILYALRLKGVEIVGITTNYGVAKLRASIAKKIVDAHFSCRPDYPTFPIIAGSSRPIGTHRQLFLSYREGYPFFSENELNSLIDLDKIGTETYTEAADFIAWAVTQYPHQISIVSIGIPTNIALAFKRCPSIVPLIKEVVIMGGGSIINKNMSIVFHEYTDNPSKWNNPSKVVPPPFGIPMEGELINWLSQGRPIHLRPNQNVSADTMASRYIFSQEGLRIKIVPHDVTSQFWLEGPSIEHLRAMADAVPSEQLKNPAKPSAVVGLLMKEWFSVRHGQNGQCPHDPLTVHEAIFCGEDSPLKYVRGRLILHDWAAFSTFVPDPNGEHLIAICVDGKEKFLDRLANVLLEKDEGSA